MTGERDDARRAVVLGLDGVPWDLLEGWLGTGHLPNLTAVAEAGVAGPLDSTRPPSTPLAWPSIATGCWPDKHGIYAFYRLRADYSRRMNTSAALGGVPLWEVATPAVVGNVPMTYPATDIDGTMVAGMMSPGIGEGFTHPASLAATIREEIPDYVVGLNWSEYRDDRETFVDDVTAMVAARRSLLRLLLERRQWRLFFFVFTAPDRLQHLCWDEAVLRRHYALLDEVVGEVRAHATAADANLFIVSDHGFGPVDRTVHVNELLARNDYLAGRDRTGTRGILDRAGVTKETVSATLDRLGVSPGAMARSLPRWLVESVAERVPGRGSLYDIGYESSSAFVHGPGNVYVNDTDRFDPGVVDPADRGRVRSALRDLFAGFADPESGEPVFSVASGDELFPTDDRAPDLVLTPEPGYKLVKGLASDVLADAPPNTGDHRPAGVFLAAGPDVSGSSFDGATVVDVAPTVLHGLGEAIPAAADGAVLDVYGPDTEPGRRPVGTRDYERAQAATTDDDADFDDVERRLRGLGYVE